MPERVKRRTSFSLPRTQYKRPGVPLGNGGHSANRASNQLTHRCRTLLQWQNGCPCPLEPVLQPACHQPIHPWSAPSWLLSWLLVLAPHVESSRRSFPSSCLCLLPPTSFPSPSLFPPQSHFVRFATVRPACTFHSGVLVGVLASSLPLLPSLAPLSDYPHTHNPQPPTNCTHHPRTTINVACH